MNVPAFMVFIGKTGDLLNLDPVLSENSNLGSCGQLVLMDQSAQPVMSTNPSCLMLVSTMRCG
jgi:hypothetical protein